MINGVALKQEVSLEKDMTIGEKYFRQPEGQAQEQSNKVSSEEAINRKFNGELQLHIDGVLPNGHVYQFGKASDTLISAGIPALPVELVASRLTDKSMQENHPFDLSEMKGLPKAIHTPVAIFRSATHIGSYVLMTEMEHEKKNYVVAIQANAYRNSINVNSIRSVHYRSANVHIANWINEGLLEYADKKYMSEWISKQQYNSADVRNQFEHAAKIVQNFENPKLSGEKITDHNRGATIEKGNNETDKFIHPNRNNDFGISM